MAWRAYQYGGMIHPALTGKALLWFAGGASIAVHVVGVAALMWTPERQARTGPLSDTGYQGSPAASETVLVIEDAPKPVDPPETTPEPPPPAPEAMADVAMPTNDAPDVGDQEAVSSAVASLFATETLETPPQAKAVPEKPPTPAPAAPVRKFVAPTLAGDGGAGVGATAPVSFAGVVGAKAQRVVYVVDASGAMASSLAFVFAELRRSVARLAPGQEFQVVVYRQVIRNGVEAADVRIYDAGARGTPTMLQANERNTRDLARWLDALKPSGRSDPITGLREALTLRPDLVFLLTRSIKRSNTEWGSGREATLDELDRLNPIDPSTGQRSVVIKAIQFIDEDPTGVLAAIAKAHGDGPGSYRVVEVKRE